MTDTKDGRAERLKAALRENLRRRKAQGRGRAETGAEDGKLTNPQSERPGRGSGPSD